MSFFYDLNKKLAELASKTEQQQIAESKKAEAVAKSPLTKALDESEKWIQKAVKHPGGLHKSLHVPADKPIPAGKLEKATHSSNPKIKKQAVLAKTLKGLHKEDQEMADEGNAFTGALAKTPKGGKFKVGNKEFTDTSSIEEEGGVPMTPKQKKFAKLAPPTDKITFADKIAGAKKEVDEMLGDVAAEAIKGAIQGRRHEEDMDEGYAEMDAWLKKRESDKGTGKFDKRERTLPGGMKATTYTRKHEDDVDSDDEVKSDTPKKRGRPAGKAKGPERVTKGAWKHKGGRVAEEEQEVCEHCGQPIVAEKAPPGEKAERMVKHIKKAYSKDGKLTPKEKSIAYATTWKAHNKGQVEEESTDKEDQKAEKAGKKVAKDIEHDEGNKSKGDNKAEKAGKKVTKDIEYDDKKDRKEKKEEKVDETTVAGSVATATTSGKSNKGGITFGKGVYEGFNNTVENMISEGIHMQVAEHALDGDEETLTITATGEDVHRLKELLKLAGLGAQADVCPTCGKADCACNELDENSPDWPTNTETLDSDTNLRTYSGGLNGPKSTGQSTTIGGGIPNLQLRRQVSMEENVELERSLFKTWKNYKG